MRLTTTARRTLTAVAAVAAVGIAAAPASAATNPLTGPAPGGAKVFPGKASKSQKAKMRQRAGKPAKLRSGQLQGKDSISIFCDPYRYDPRGFYWIRCHVVYVGGPYGYEDWYEYDYWNGRTWVFWFDSSI